MKSRINVLLLIHSPAPYLQVTPPSILEQSLEGIQLITILDGPCPETEYLIRGLIPQSKIVSVPAHSGIGVALNAGLRESNADYIARIDSDDAMSPTRLKLQRDFRDSHSDCVAVSSAVKLIDGQSNIVGDRSGPKSVRKIKRRLRWRNPISHPATTFRREAAVEVGGYPDQAQHLKDFVLWLKLAAIGEIVSFPDTLTQYRIHGEQLSKSINFGKASLKELLMAREVFAKSECKSLTAARLRQGIWCPTQIFRGRISFRSLC